MNQGNKNLIGALLEVQRKIRNPSNTAINPFFKSKYAPLPDILNCVRPLLTENEILLIHREKKPIEHDINGFIQYLHTIGMATNFNDNWTNIIH
jgi:hypothetical protein